MEVTNEKFTLIEKRLDELARARFLYTIGFLIFIIGMMVIGFVMAEQNNAGSFARGIDNFFDYPADLFIQAWAAGWGWPETVLSYIPLLLQTINMAVFSTGLGFFFAVILGVLGSRNINDNAYIVLIVRRFMDICRSFPELVIAMILLFLMGRSLLPAVIAITIHTAGALGKLFSEAIENIDDKPIEGLTSVGGSWLQKVRYAVIPQVLPLFFSYGLLRTEINVRASTILGFVGAGGIGEALSTVIQWRYGDDVFAIMFLLVATITSLDYLSRYVRGRLIGDQ